MEKFRPFQYWILWMSKMHMVTLHHVIIVYNDMFDQTDGVMASSPKKKTAWKEDFYFGMKFARLKLPKSYGQVTTITGMLEMSAHISEPVRKLRSLRKWDKGMDMDPEDKTFYTTHYQETFVKYVEDEYCAKDRGLPIIEPGSVLCNNLLSSAMASRSGQSSYDPYDMSSDDEEDLMPKNVTETMPGRSDHGTPWLTAGSPNFNSLPKLPQNWGQFDPNHLDYHSDPMVISSTFWIPDITDWWWQHEEMHSKYADLSNIAHDIFSNKPHRVGLEASFSLARDVMCWRQSNPTATTHCETVIVRQFARTINGISACYDPAFDMTNTKHNTEMKSVVEDRTLHRMAKVHDVVEMWQGSQNLCVTQNESCAQNTQVTAVRYISDTEEIVKASWSNV